MFDWILWGRHPRYANGSWIKLARGRDDTEFDLRRNLGFELQYLPSRLHPDQMALPKEAGNPYPKQAGFSQRVRRAEQALRKLAFDPSADVFTRSFDDCFEMHDGKAVVWTLMHKALQEPDNAGDSLTLGIQRLFGQSEDGHRYPLSWLQIYYGTGVEGGPSQLSLDL